jgi:hypothetical protein
VPFVAFLTAWFFAGSFTEAFRFWFVKAIGGWWLTAVSAVLIDLLFELFDSLNEKLLLILQSQDEINEGFRIGFCDIE